MTLHQRLLNFVPLASALLFSVTDSTSTWATEQLSDLASPQQRVFANVEWAQPNRILGLSEDELHTIMGHVNGLEVRLDTSAFVGRQARIYLRLPLQIRGLRNAGGLRMEWDARDAFLDGSVIPGTRSLLFEGVVPGSLVRDILNITLHIDSRMVSRELNIEPVYEIETP
ncbi:MAG: hypothetical protein ACR2RL_10470 [Gammaproteobacteria bacterium]